MKKTVLQNKYSEYLSSLDVIDSVEVFESGDVQCDVLIGEELYSILLFSLSDNKLPIVLLCNPKEGKAQKPHQLHLIKEKLIHLCLSVREDISVKNSNYKEILDYTLKRIIRLLSLTDDEERREFRKEFLYFWNKISSNKERVELFINTSSAVKKLSVNRKKNVLLLADPSVNFNHTFIDKAEPEILNAIYIPLVNSSRILPPYEEKKWTNEYLIDICNQCISEENAELLESISITSKSVFLAFEMEIPETLPVIFLLKLDFRKKKGGNLYERFNEVVNLEHLSSQRCDSGYLYKRIGLENISANKNVLVIGAGSLGSYILSELPKMGVSKITIYDNDKFSIENVMRHKLGYRYNKLNKAFAMELDLELSYPELMVNFKEERFTETDLDCYGLEEYDLIIVATGGTDFMLRLNKGFKELDIKTTVIFTWIEANGVGVHALPIKYSKKGCFQCLYTDAETNKAHYGSRNLETKAVGTGCGSVFNSYGNLTLLKGSAMILELTQLHLSGLLNSDRNLLHSVRTISPLENSGYIIAKREFETSKDFYISERCKVCGI
ncbi:ThiF family adenylyltransferase [bacterium AH-315-E09]|nr:ThiF family adenylyltransferase [bacterium AH-315-E09]